MRLFTVFVLLVAALLACSDSSVPVPGDSLRIAVTTSTRDSGLLEAILPEFESQRNVRVDVLAVGTGAALELGRSGDVDLLIVHDRKAEIQFMKEGVGTRHAPLFANPFVIVGPGDDPAQIRGTPPLFALQALNKFNAKYVSRGDDSGTNRKEQSLFDKSGIKRLWRNCVESGRGMGATLTMAHQMQAYSLADRATFLRFKPKIDLEILVENNAVLSNPYSALVIAEKLRSKGQRDLADSLCDFLLSAETQLKIRQFECGGERPFLLIHPNGG